MPTGNVKWFDTKKGYGFIIGETGLDYYRSEGSLEWQQERFRRHIRAARARSSPLGRPIAFWAFTSKYSFRAAPAVSLSMNF